MNSNIVTAGQPAPPAVPADKSENWQMASQWKMERNGNMAAIIPHTMTFQSMTNWMSQTYRFRFDEALNRNYDNAKAMQNDGFIQGLYRNRMQPVTRGSWRIIAKGGAAKDKIVKGRIEDFYSTILKKTPTWHDFRRNILQCVWFGRFGVQIAFDTMTYDGKPFTWEGKQAYGISHWLPHLGDKITFTFDWEPCIRISPLLSGDWSRRGATVLHPGDPRILRESAKYRWTEEGPVIILNSPELRKQFLISIFEANDAPWDDPQLAGGVRGVGLRHYSFWNWDNRQEIVSWAMLHLEEFGANGYTVVGYDGPEGLRRSQQTFNNPQDRILFVPVTPGNDEKVTDMVTRLEPAGQGNDAIFKWAQEYFNAHLIILFLGHPLNMSTGPTGMGSNMGDKAETKLREINQGDAEILDVIMTQDVLALLKEKNDPTGDYELEFESAVRAVDKTSGMQAVKTFYDMGGKVSTSHARMLADIPELAEGEDFLQNPQHAQMEQQLAIQGAAPPPGTKDDSYMQRGAEHQDAVKAMMEGEQSTPPQP